MYLPSIKGWLALLLFLAGTACENNKQGPSNNQTKVAPIAELFNQYDASSEHVFGQRHPKAPPETQQFHFMIGKFICQDSILINGVWKESVATWESSYILNGFGIKDTYRNDDYAGTSIRFFSTRKKNWQVYFFGMPGEHTGLWDGEAADGKMIMRQKRKGPNGENMEGRLTFYNITENSFDWKGELRNLDKGTSTVNWKIKAQRE